jgi:3D (Asp-Asp-Asp) domain-containing protein
MLIICLIVMLYLFINVCDDLANTRMEMNTGLAKLRSNKLEIKSLKRDVLKLESILSDAFNTRVTRDTLVFSKTVTATGYTAREEECNSEPWITASGRPSRVGGIAVSRDLQAMGLTKGKLIIIKNMGLFKVEDLTAEMKRKNTDNPVPITNTIDILHAHVKAAEIFGTGSVEIIWLGEG